MKALSPLGNDFLQAISSAKVANGQNSLPATSRHAYARKDTLELRPFSAQTFPMRSSKNPYFARNNPHPSRVRHIKGLLDAPVCMVESAYGDSVSSTRLGITLSASDQIKLNQEDLNLKLPVNINSYRPKERAIPSIGLVPVTEDWRDQLRRIALASGLQLGKLASNGHNSSRSVVSRQQSRNSQRNALKNLEDNYVRNVTTRDGNRPADTLDRAGLNSRMTERPATQQSAVINEKVNSSPKVDILESLDKFDLAMEHISAFPENESYVFQMLGRILQTDSADAVRTWLVSAPEREKELVVQMIQAVSSSGFQPPLIDSNEHHSPRSVHEPIYEDQLLQYESSIDVNDIKTYNEEETRKRLLSQKKSREQSDIINGPGSATNHWIRPGTSDAKAQKSQLYEWSVNSIVNKPSTPFKIMSNGAAEDMAKNKEIEDIRSRLASSNSVRVFSHQENRNKSSRQSERQKTVKTRSRSSTSKSPNRTNGITMVAPFQPVQE